MMGAARKVLVSQQGAKVSYSSKPQQLVDEWGNADNANAELEGKIKPPKPQFQGLSQELITGRTKSFIQPKLAIGEPNDRHEQEADRVAAQVVQQMHSPPVTDVQRSPEITPLKPRQHTALQGKSAIGSPSLSSELESSIHQSRGSGQPLDSHLRLKLEQSFGTDFSRVRVHTDNHADQLNRSLQARAFTTGQDLFFKQGEYQPNSRQGQELIAHELTHTIQQEKSNTITPIQRKVYIKGKLYGWNQKTKTKHGDVGEGDRKVSNMISDSISRYFDSKDEMNKYARKQTEHIGYLKSKVKSAHKTWVRLDKEHLFVLGETHTETVLSDVVNAVGTDKYRHEGYTDFTEKLKTENEEVAQIAQARDLTIRSKYQTDPDHAKDHRGESLYPKILRGLFGLSLGHGGKLIGSEAEMILYNVAIAIAKELRDNSELYNAYMDNQEGLDSKKGLSEEGWERFKFAFTDYAKERIEEERNNAPKSDQRAFDEHWHPVRKQEGSPQSTDYSKEIVDVEKLRDFSLFQHVKDAERQNYLLFGMGELHRNRLKELLDNANIKNQYMDNFIADQQEKYPQ